MQPKISQTEAANQSNNSPSPTRLPGCVLSKDGADGFPETSLRSGSACKTANAEQPPLFGAMERLGRRQRRRIESASLLFPPRAHRGPKFAFPCFSL